VVVLIPQRYDKSLFCSTSILAKVLSIDYPIKYAGSGGSSDCVVCYRQGLMSRLPGPRVSQKKK